MTPHIVNSFQLAWFLVKHKVTGHNLTYVLDILCMLSSDFSYMLLDQYCRYHFHC